MGFAAAIIVLVKSDFTGLLVQSESEIEEFSLNVVVITTALFLNTSVVALYANKIIPCFSKFPSDPSVLLLADLYYTRLALCGCQEPLSQGNLMDLFERLHPNISTGVSKVICCFEHMQSNLYFNNKT